MDSALALLRLALDRGWTVGLLFIIFCGLVLIAGALGMVLPPVVREWAGAGVLFGIAIVLVSAAAQISHGTARSLERGRHDATARRETEDEANETLKNLSALTAEEIPILYSMLKAGPQRFEVHITSPAQSLLDKGVLVPVRQVGGLSWICEVDPAIMSRRAMLIASIERKFGGPPPIA